MQLRSKLGQARGLGSAKEGVGHWWTQRVTAIALVPLSIWFVIAAIGQTGADYAQFAAWLGIFGNALLMALTVIVLFYHAQLGMQVVIEDYVHGAAAQITAQLVVRFVLFVLAVSCLLAIVLVAIKS